MRRIIAAGSLAVLLSLAGTAPAWAGAGNPSGTGPPSQSCQTIEGNGGTTPGHASGSPGSPFNEPGINTPLGGTGGQHYSNNSQYDVACFHNSARG
ncbi:hypothetical protein [Streptacidiphilus jiangxiensis]|uniref:Adenylate cyclase n=1 Tax=Streptacidiphilus jiangxiensis TaxID=235985 RepID=A0A1H7XK00_STRJI|nr:hypothetical protein [Streptacidiphilus jiangxiensis]SEM34126.1 hypothetical protein SAMN05414137_12471 [Streptacidiphilus jiangxiensis]